MLALSLVACGGDAGNGGGTDGKLTKENVKIGLIYIGDPSDNGYNYAHEKGRLYMQEQLGLRDDQMIVKANVSEDLSLIHI